MPHPELERCIKVIKKLRHPTDGCPWDLEQTHQTLLKYLIEESYEFIDATESGNPGLMEEEIGDVLLQVLLHATIAEEKKNFSLETVAKALADKIVRRHPHVFEKRDTPISTEEVIENWKEIKIKEKGVKKYSIDAKLLLAPALEAAFRIGEVSGTVNFDWQDYQQVVFKVEEEWQEVKEELPPGGQFNQQRVKEEIGDLLFSVAQLARHVGLSPEECLKSANKKFIHRFQKVEDLVKQTGKTLTETPQSTLEEFWVKVKQQ
ncbi:MAG TPA: nucleoside triphosphate pyrophosphohydrolase [Bacteriovoracaceae bacterium]|nr:nucleoside triphosphate pyrophosphohydrolase [Bacteriovoracaceae bacterium]